MQEHQGLKISKKSFFSSLSILGAFMMVAGFLTKVLPAGSYERILEEGREKIVPGSFQLFQRPEYPFYRWFTAPIEVLFGKDQVTIIVIILFLLFIGASFRVLDHSGILRYIMEGLVQRFEKRKYVLLGLMIFFFMSFGALFGIFEELIILVPMAVALAYSFGWDSLLGLGMSAMASGFGFASAILNPFTLGVSQSIAGLPAYSGSFFRMLIFLTIYGVLYGYLTLYAKRIEKNPSYSLVYEEDRKRKEQYVRFEKNQNLEKGHLKKAVEVYGVFLLGMMLLIVLGFFIPLLSGLTLPLLAILFLVASITAGTLSNYGSTKILMKDLLGGLVSMLPAVLLILLAMSIKHIMTEGQVMDVLLYYAAERLQGLSPYQGVVGLYVLILLLNFFVGSGSAKAFLVMPILLPLTDLLDITRQTAVQAFLFGDGFSNLLYPTNPTLMIALGLTVVSYPKWIRWSIKIQLLIFLLSLGFLYLATRFSYGPF